MSQFIHRYKSATLFALLLWLFAGVSGMHGHFCFDGKEPPVSLHIDVLEGQHLHAASEKHQDADVDPSQSILAKTYKQDIALPILVALIIVLLGATQQLSLPFVPFFSPKRIAGLRPPLRAPPVSPIR